VLTNPKYVEELQQAANKVKQYYEDTYAQYKAGNYDEVISRSNYAQQNYKNDPLIPRFAYLGTLAAGKNADRKIFRENLLAFITKYPKSDIADDAQNIINYMDKEHPEIREAHDIQVSRKMFRPDMDTEHQFVFLVKKGANTNQLIFNIINFNLDNFDKLNLKIDAIDLNPKQTMVYIRPFKNGTDAMAYLKAINSSDAILKDITDKNVIPMVISLNNLSILKAEKSADLYLKFFAENYR